MDYFNKLVCLEIVILTWNQFGSQFPKEGVIHLGVPLEDFPIIIQLKRNIMGERIMILVSLQHMIPMCDKDQKIFGLHFLPYLFAVSQQHVGLSPQLLHFILFIALDLHVFFLNHLFVPQLTHILIYRMKDIFMIIQHKWIFVSYALMFGWTSYCQGLPNSTWQACIGTTSDGTSLWYFPILNLINNSLWTLNSPYSLNH